jgi:hypothetical protein
LACLSIGGGCIVTVRDHESEERGKNILKPYGVRVASEKRHLIFQVWDFNGEQYDLALENAFFQPVLVATSRP